MYVFVCKNFICLLKNKNKNKTKPKKCRELKLNRKFVSLVHERDPVACGAKQQKQQYVVTAIAKTNVKDFTRRLQAMLVGAEGKEALVRLFMQCMYVAYDL